jgi:parvulin-like peptidyl-prolyl isomerase
MDYARVVVAAIAWVAVALLTVPAIAQNYGGYRRDAIAPVIDRQRAGQALPPPRGAPSYSIRDEQPLGDIAYPNTNLPPWQETSLGRRAPRQESHAPQEPIAPPRDHMASPIPASAVPDEARPEGAVLAGSFGPESGPQSGLKQFDEAMVMAVVGDQYILAGDVEPEVELLLAPYKGKVPADQYEAQKQLLVRQVLKGAVDTKIVYLDFLRTAPADRIEVIKEKIDKDFEKNFYEMAGQLAKAEESEIEEIVKQQRLLGRLALMAQRENLTTMAEVDAMLRRYGSSLKKQRANYREQLLSQEMIRRNIKFDAEITHAEMLDYFSAHADEYAYPAKVRWEQLTARFDKFPSRQAAYEAIAAMGNAVYLGGAPLPAVARRESQGSTAAEGGQHDWTGQGSLASKELDEALFSIEPNKLSPIIEDHVGYHIVRVHEREPAGRKQFGEVQDEIEQKIRAERRSADVDKYMVDVKKNARVWTIYDDEQQTAATDRPSTR